ncbi:hypothetical protein B0H10DRAFT_1381514 [Mycena sp. CBHHK59/15]|nr:hypothetical protein B0H10DRAFT_1381514 [Mycena sp. CBHHK59/15]
MTPGLGNGPRAHHGADRVRATVERGRSWREQAAPARPQRARATPCADGQARRSVLLGSGATVGSAQSVIARSGSSSPCPLPTSRLRALRHRVTQGTPGYSTNRRRCTRRSASGAKTEPRRREGAYAPGEGILRYADVASNHGGRFEVAWASSFPLPSDQTPREAWAVRLSRCARTSPSDAGHLRPRSTPRLRLEAAVSSRGVGLACHVLGHRAGRVPRTQASRRSRGPGNTRIHYPE